MMSGVYAATTPTEVIMFGILLLLLLLLFQLCNPNNPLLITEFSRGLGIFQVYTTLGSSDSY